MLPARHLQPTGRNPFSKLLPGLAAVGITAVNPCIYNFRITRMPFAMNLCAMGACADLNLCSHFFEVAAEFKIICTQAGSNLAIHPRQIELVPARIDLDRGEASTGIGIGCADLVGGLLLPQQPSHVGG
jgi:hypothetical protein